jgi:hypothetical protein
MLSVRHCIVCLCVLCPMLSFRTMTK